MCTSKYLFDVNFLVSMCSVCACLATELVCARVSFVICHLHVRIQEISIWHPSFSDLPPFFCDMKAHLHNLIWSIVSHEVDVLSVLLLYGCSEHLILSFMRDSWWWLHFLFCWLMSLLRLRQGTLFMTCKYFQGWNNVYAEALFFWIPVFFLCLLQAVTKQFLCPTF